MTCFFFCKKKNYETQVEPLDKKSELIGRPLHQTAHVQKAFGYEDNQATRWKRRTVETLWDRQAKDETSTMVQGQGIPVSRLGEGKSSYESQGQKSSTRGGLRRSQTTALQGFDPAGVGARGSSKVSTTDMTLSLGRGSSKTSDMGLSGRGSSTVSGYPRSRSKSKESDVGMPLIGRMNTTIS